MMITIGLELSSPDCGNASRIQFGVLLIVLCVYAFVQCVRVHVCARASLIFERHIKHPGGHTTPPGAALINASTVQEFGSRN